ncbi:MAG: DUF664 domain-containing protein [Chloroflexi bacterium]|nr:DUF664 domain-containing protein [Chloroflexota bacterium]
MTAAADELVWELTGLHKRVRQTIEGLDPDALDRRPTDGANSIAVLVTHMLGSELGWLHLAAGRAHERDRASEFAVRGRSPAELLRAVDEAERSAKELIQFAFEAGVETLRDRPGARPVTVSFCLTHAVAHSAEHVGQAELTRQVLTAAGGPNTR